VRTARHRPAVLFKTQQHAPQHVAADKVARPVNRIDDPRPARARRFGHALLAPLAVFGKHLLEQTGDQLLAFFVGNRHRRIVALILHLDALLKVAHGQRGTCLRDAAHRRDFAFVIHLYTIIYP
jgi:hypothetical protein